MATVRCGQDGLASGASVAAYKAFNVDGGLRGKHLQRPAETYIMNPVLASAKSEDFASAQRKLLEIYVLSLWKTWLDFLQINRNSL